MVQLSNTMAPPFDGRGTSSTMYWGGDIDYAGRVKPPPHYRCTLAVTPAEPGLRFQRPSPSVYPNGRDCLRQPPCCLFFCTARACPTLLAINTPHFYLPFTTLSRATATSWGGLGSPTREGRRVFSLRFEGLAHRYRNYPDHSSDGADRSVRSGVQYWMPPTTASVVHWESGRSPTTVTNSLAPVMFLWHMPFSCPHPRRI